MRGYPWSEEEITNLFKYYPDKKLSSEEILSFFPNRTWHGLIGKAKQYKLPRAEIFGKQSELSIFLEESNEQAYWLGLCYADGYFGEDGRITLSLHEQDYDHMILYSSFIKSKNPNPIKKQQQMAICSTYDKPIVKLIKEKYDLHNKKTYNPPKFLPFNSKKYMLSWLVGFIDGDGHIEQKSSNLFQIKITTHISWHNFYLLLQEFIGFGNVNINHVKNTASFSITKQEHIALLKAHAIETSLPCMDRKWKNVGSFWISKSNIRYNKILKLVLDGKTNKEIQIIMGYKHVETVRNAKVRMRKNGDLPPYTGKK